MRRTLYTLIAGGLILFGFRRMMHMRQKSKMQYYLQSMMRAMQKNRWLRKIMMEGLMKGLRRFQIAR